MRPAQRPAFGSNGRSRLLRRKAGDDWDCEDSTCCLTIDLRQEGEKQRPGDIVRVALAGGARY